MENHSIDVFRKKTVETSSKSFFMLVSDYSNLKQSTIRILFESDGVCGLRDVYPKSTVCKTWKSNQKSFNIIRIWGFVWLDRGAWRALYPKSSIRGGDSRGRLL